MATTRIFNLMLLFLFSIFLSSCEKIFEDRVEGNNNVITRIRSINTFDEIYVEGNFNVYFTIADTTSLRIEAEENLVPLIITKVSGQQFYVKPKDDFQLDNNKAMNIFLTSPNLEGVVLSGSGLLVCDSLFTDFLSVEITGSGKVQFDKLDLNDIEGSISGSGDIVLAGEVDRSEFEITGSGAIRALDLVQNDCDARITGSGNIYVNVVDYLKARITGSGNIYYVGNPIVDEIITGSGDVRRY